jgi:hypothetical protein
MSKNEERLFSYYFENLKDYIKYISKNNFSLISQEKCECQCVTTIHHIIKQSKNCDELSYYIRFILDFEKNKRLNSNDYKIFVYKIINFYSSLCRKLNLDRANSPSFKRAHIKLVKDWFVYSLDKNVDSVLNTNIVEINNNLKDSYLLVRALLENCIDSILNYLQDKNDYYDDFDGAEFDLACGYEDKENWDSNIKWEDDAKGRWA